MFKPGKNGVQNRRAGLIKTLPNLCESQGGSARTLPMPPAGGGLAKFGGTHLGDPYFMSPGEGF